MHATDLPTRSALWAPLRDPGGIELPRRFPSPFDETGPHPLARLAAAHLLQAVARDGLAPGVPLSVLQASGAGKMLGVLVARDRDGRLGVLRAFSGMLAGRLEADGWCPSLFDLDARRAVEEEGGHVVAGLTAEARDFAAGDALRHARTALADLMAAQHGEAESLREAHRARRAARRSLRSTMTVEDPAQLDDESRRDRAERRALRRTHEAARSGPAARVAEAEAHLAELEERHAAASAQMLRRLYDTLAVPGRGGSRPLRSFFVPGEPPGGAGDCAAPKLLAAALRLGLEPVAMAEFWCGAPPPGGGRAHGSFHASCRDKCAPILGWMLDGVDVAPPQRFEPPASRHLAMELLFEDEWIVVVGKPAGLLSVPSRPEPDGDCVLARLRAGWPRAQGPLLVHRLDLDTSGVMLAAKDPATHRALQALFAARAVDKRYVAVLDGHVRGDAGRIALALRGDPADRPRQVVDAARGREAVTDWQVLAHGPGAATRVALWPRTGRTHQLRVHAAHPLGLGAPVLGDRLYGNPPEGEGRLMLHAEEVALPHPVTGDPLRVAWAAPF